MANVFQGQSKATYAKQETLAAFISAHSNAVEVIQQKHAWAGPYCYIETNAGCGWNDKVGVTGSPLIALKALQGRSKLKYQCTFIEKHSPSAERLTQCIVNEGGDKSMVINGDHCMVLPDVLIPDASFGLVYADPNALTDSPEEALRTFFSKNSTSKIDLLFNLDAHMRRRVIAGQEKAGTPGNYDDLRRLMRRIGKRHWWIREPFVCAGAKWTFLFGSNNAQIKIKGLGKTELPMFQVESWQGKRIVAELMGEIRLEKPINSHLPYRSYREYLAHPKFLAVRAQVMRRSSGMCELCHLRAATEIHHRVYPKWGSFDHSNALLALCHSCHCHVHGVSK